MTHYFQDFMGDRQHFRIKQIKPLTARVLRQSHRKHVGSLSILSFSLCLNPLFNHAVAEDDPTYRYLDWVSIQTLKDDPQLQHIDLPRCCGGIYLPPIISADIIDPTLAPIQISADRYDADVNGTATFEGNVIIEHAGRQLISDHITLDQQTKATTLTGNVSIRQDGMLLIGDSATFNLDEKHMDIRNAEYVIHENHIHGEASRIYNPNPQTLALDSGTYTTCEPDANTWHFSADDIVLNNESGWGTAKHATLEVKDVPVFYFPWVMFPVDDRRQTGLLFPTIGEDDDNGTDIAVPLYLNLAPNMDSTVTFRNLSKRGSLVDGEFRFLSSFGEGQIGGSYLPDDQQTDSDRKLALLTHNSNNQLGWNIDADYTKVSDIDYFSDLDTTLNASSQTHLDQKALLTYRQRQWQGSLLVQDYQTLDDLLTDDELPYRKLPQVRLQGQQATFLGSDSHQLAMDWRAEFTRFEHPKESTEGIEDARRTHLSPDIRYHFSRPWGYITPQLQGFYSYYDLEGDSATFESNIQDASPERHTYVASVDSGLFFDRSLTFSERAYTQTLEPRVFYVYSPDVDQDDIPTFDTSELSFGYHQMFRNNRFSGADRVGDANQLALGLTTRFHDIQRGHEVLRASIGQVFYFEDRNVQLDSDDAPDSAPRSAIIGKLTLPLNTAMTIDSEIQWNDQRNHIDKTDVQLSYHDDDHQIINAAYRQLDNDVEDPGLDDTLEQLDLSTAWSINHNWRIASRWIYDIQEERTFEGLFGVEYDSCCWSVQLMHRHFLEEDGTDGNGNSLMTTRRGTYLQLQFKGLGGVGNALDSILDNAILGYEQRRKALENQFK